MRIVLLVHRYLGVVLGLLMSLWCLSGFVMMYRGYPQLSEAARLRGLTPLHFAAQRGGPSLPDDARLSSFQIETAAGRPILRIRNLAGPPQSVDLGTGAVLSPLDAAAAGAVAAAYAAGDGVTGKLHDLGSIAGDQWTIEDARRNAPMRHFRVDDPQATEIYIAQRTGRVVQATTRSQRFWAWLGAIPHWLYPTVLRQHPVLWTNVVVFAALLGCFLTVFGLYIGVVRFKRYDSSRWSPYRGWVYWHHLIGLAFGLLTLTWVTSGLMTMNPWGLFDTPVGEVQRQRLAGDISGAAVKTFLAKAPTLPTNLVELTAAPLSGRLFVIATDRGGHSVRLGPDGQPAPLIGSEVMRAVRAASSTPVADFTHLTAEDDYYYSGYDGTVSLPVWRVRLADAEATTLYIDAASGQVVRATDRAARASRWWRTGLHDWDFAGLRKRPVWDLVVLSLLAGVTVTCGLGAWLGLRRLWRDFLRLRSAWLQGRFQRS